MIGKKTIEEIKKSVGELLDVHQGEIDSAYIKSDGGLSLTLGVNISPVAPGVHMVSTGISFVALRVKDKIECKVNEDQEPLFKAVEKMRPKKGDGIDSVTITHQPSGESVTLRAKENGGKK